MSPLTFSSARGILEPEDSGVVSGDRPDLVPASETTSLFLYFDIYLSVVTPHIGIQYGENGGSYSINIFDLHVSIHAFYSLI